MSNEVELKSCPFCGEKPQTNYFKDKMGSVATVKCENEDCITRDPICVEKISMKMAIEAWNTRHNELVELDVWEVDEILKRITHYDYPERCNEIKNTPTWTMAQAICSKFGQRQTEDVGELVEALRDMLAGWKYIRRCHGDLYGVGWDRAQQKAEQAIAKFKDKKD